VVLIVSDGLRWQEIFTGADPTLLNEEHGGIWASEASLKQQFWDDDPKVRRRLLFPFLWDVVAKQGQIFGIKPRAALPGSRTVSPSHIRATTRC